MRRVLKGHFFIAFATTTAIGFVCGLLTWLDTTSIRQALAVAGTFVALAYMPALLLAFLVIDPRRQEPKPALRAEMTDYPQATSYVCRRCGRTVGEEILTCPGLPSGNCAFRKVDLVSTDDRHTAAFVTLLICGFSLVGLVLALSGLLDGYALPCGIVLLFCIGFGLFGTFYTKTLLQDPTSGPAWTRTSLFGLTLTRVLTARAELLPAPPLSLPPPPFPPSVIALSRILIPTAHLILDHAVVLLRATLLGLWARGCVRVCRYRKYIAHGRAPFRSPRDVYVFSLDEESDWASVDGELEKRVLRVLSTWPMEKGEQSQIWPYGPPIYELIRSVYDEDVLSPERWIAYCVDRDATAHGWDRLRGWQRKRDAASSPHRPRLHVEQIRLNALSFRVRQEQPHFSQVLDEQTRRAIASRRQISDYP